MFKSKLATFVGALVLAGSSFAGQQGCPSLDAIKAEGVSMAEEIGSDIYYTYQISDYNTDSNWGFVIVPIEADSDGAAIDEANEILDSMTSIGVPEQNSGPVICGYETGRQDILAVAIKADDDMMLTPMKLKQYINKAHK